MIQTRAKASSGAAKPASQAAFNPNTPAAAARTFSTAAAPQPEFPHYRNGIHVLRHILETEGGRGLYRGFFSSLMTYMPSSAIWWATNAIARRNLNWAVYGMPSADTHPQAVATIGEDEDEETLSHPWNEYDIPDSVLARPPADLAILALSGIAAGFTSAFLTNPLDVLKTRIQTRNTGSGSGMIGAFKELLRSDGVPGCFRGVRARMMSTVPTSTLLIFSYELVKSLSVKSPD